MTQPAPTSSYVHTAPRHPERRAQLIVELTQLALSAPDIPSAVMPALQTDRSGEGSAYFQVGDGMFRARSASGEMPQGPAMEAILAHGLPADTPLMQALLTAPPRFFSTITRVSLKPPGSRSTASASLAVLPVKNREPCKVRF